MTTKGAQRRRPPQSKIDFTYMYAAHDAGYARIPRWDTTGRVPQRRRPRGGKGLS
jgi:hypothetical protein